MQLQFSPLPSEVSYLFMPFLSHSFLALWTFIANINFIISAKWVSVDVDAGNDLCRPPRTQLLTLVDDDAEIFIRECFAVENLSIVKQASFVKYLWYFSAHDSVFTYAEHQQKVLSGLHLPVPFSESLRDNPLAFFYFSSPRVLQNSIVMWKFRFSENDCMGNKKK